MEQFIWETPEELDQKLAQRVRKIRKRRSITQEKLASISGVSYGSIKNFPVIFNENCNRTGSCR